jgi:predicted ATPase
VKIKTVEIRNLRNIAYVRLDDLGPLVILAGQNGTGKSTILEAIGIWKTLATGAYGGQERLSEVLEIIRAGTDEASISVAIVLTAQELHALTGSSDPIDNGDAETVYGRTIVLKRGQNQSLMSMPFEDLAQPPGIPFPRDRDSRPEAPIFDYYGPHRIMQGGQFQSNPSQNTAAVEEVSRLPGRGQISKRDLRQFLFNIDERVFYQVADQIEEFKESGSAPIIDLSKRPDDFADLRALLHVVLPDLTFSRVVRQRNRPTDFLFRVSGGHEVSIDHLSSGEKEVLMIFLELFRTNPNNSIIMIDEPELHLNASVESRIIPYILQSLVQARNNQVWIATHSTAILSTAPDASLYKISHPTHGCDNQSAAVGASVTRAAVLRDLVGELGIFTTADRFVFIEGESSGKSIDKRVLELLFPALAPRVVFIPSGQQLSVQAVARKVQDILAEEIPFGEFFAIRDRDRLSDDEVRRLEKSRRFRVLPRCMIENFLLDEVLWVELFRRRGTPTSAESVRLMRETVANSLINEEVSSRIDHLYRESLDTRDFRDVPDFPSIKKLERFRASIDSLIAAHDSLKAELESTVRSEVVNGRYIITFHGKLLIERLAAKLGVQIPMHELLPLLGSIAFDIGRVPPDLSKTIDSLLASGAV